MGKQHNTRVAGVQATESTRLALPWGETSSTPDLITSGLKGPADPRGERGWGPRTSLCCSPQGAHRDWITIQATPRAAPLSPWPELRRVMGDPAAPPSPPARTQRRSPAFPAPGPGPVAGGRGEAGSKQRAVK